VDHIDVQTLLAAAPLDKMDMATRAAINAHLDVCAECRNAAAFVQGLERELKPLRASEGMLKETVQATRAVKPVTVSISRRGHRSSVRATQQRTGVGGAAVAIAALVAVTVLVIFFASGNRSASKPQTKNESSSSQAQTTVPVAKNNPTEARPVDAQASVPPAQTDRQQAEQAPALFPRREILTQLEDAPPTTQADNEIHGSSTQAWVPETEEAARDLAQNTPKPEELRSGKARLFIDAKNHRDQDTVNLATNAVGEHITESDLRVQKRMGNDELAVAMGSLDDSSLIQLDRVVDVPKATLEKSVLQLAIGLKCLLHLKRERSAFYVLEVTEYMPDEYVDLQWTPVSGTDATRMVAVLRPAKKISGRLPEGILMTPPPEKEKKSK
jgi:hypothetical protein